MLLNIDQNHKTIKGQALGFMTGILYLAPYRESGVNVCPFASKGCIKACLYRSGMAVIHKHINAARIAKTKALFADKKSFVDNLDTEIKKGVQKAAKKGMQFVVRLNGTSDLPVETWGLMERNPNVQFYDYTKNPMRMEKYLNGEMPSNYHLTFSLSEKNMPIALNVLAMGGNVAMVFRTRDKNKLPKTYMGYRVVLGDESDVRILDPKGVIVGLTMKGSAQRDTRGFVQPLIEEKIAIAA